MCHKPFNSIPSIKSPLPGAGQYWFDEAAWAAAQWGQLELGDRRRTKRAVELGLAMVRQPEASLPEQLKSWGATKAAYRLLNESSLNLEKLSASHWQQSRQASGQVPVVLMLQDTTEVDLTSHKTMQGLGPIGNGRGRGFLLHSVLAVIPEGEQIVGMVHQQTVLRQPRVAGKRPEQRSPEGLVWEKAVAQVGSPPEACRWVHVGDSGSDNFGLLVACAKQARVEFLIRLCRNRLLGETAADGSEQKLLTYGRQLPPQGPEIQVTVSPRQGQPQRQARLRLSWSQVTLPAPRRHADPHWAEHAPLTAWIVCATEIAPPEDCEPLVWLLLSSCPVTCWSEAYQCTRWYSYRWLIEEFHKGLKTGCRLEERLLDHRHDLERLLGFLTPIAVRLLQLRQYARLAPDTFAHTLIDPHLLQLLVAELPAKKLSVATMTISQFWYGLAQLGGHLGRKSDGPPGWLTLWRGYRYFLLLLRGTTYAFL